MVGERCRFEVCSLALPRAWSCWLSCGVCSCCAVPRRGTARRRGIWVLGCQSWMAEPVKPERTESKMRVQPCSSALPAVGILHWGRDQNFLCRSHKTSAATVLLAAGLGTRHENCIFPPRSQCVLGQNTPVWPGVLRTGDSWGCSAWRREGSRVTLEQPSVPEGAYRKDGEGLLTRAWSGRTRASGFKLKGGRFRSDTWKKFFTMRVMRSWHRLPREAVAAPSLAVFKGRLDGALSNLVWWKVSLLMAGGLESGDI